MRSAWEPVPLQEPEADPLSPTERVKTMCKLLGMTATGLAIGCVFVLARHALGMDE